MIVAPRRGERQQRQQLVAPLADHVVDEELRRGRQHQPGQPADQHQQQAERQPPLARAQIRSRRRARLRRAWVSSFRASRKSHKRNVAALFRCVDVLHVTDARVQARKPRAAATANVGQSAFHGTRVFTTETENTEGQRRKAICSSEKLLPPHPLCMAIDERGNGLECGSRSCRFCMPQAMLELRARCGEAERWRPRRLMWRRPAPPLFCHRQTVDSEPLSQPTRGGGETPPGQPARRQRSACGTCTLCENPDRDQIQKTTAVSSCLPSRCQWHTKAAAAATALQIGDDKRLFDQPTLVAACRGASTRHALRTSRSGKRRVCYYATRLALVLYLATSIAIVLLWDRFIQRVPRGRGDRAGAVAAAVHRAGDADGRIVRAGRHRVHGGAAARLCARLRRGDAARAWGSRICTARSCRGSGRCGYSLAHGEWPLWNPFILGGDILAAAAQPAVYDPFQWIGMLIPLADAFTFGVDADVLPGRLLHLGVRARAGRERHRRVHRRGRFHVLRDDGLLRRLAARPRLGVSPAGALRRAPRGARGEGGAADAGVRAGDRVRTSGVGAARRRVGAVYGVVRMARVRRLRPLVLAIGAGVVALLLTAVYLLPFFEAVPQTLENYIRRDLYATTSYDLIAKPDVRIDRIKRTFVPGFRGMRSADGAGRTGRAGAGGDRLALARVGRPARRGSSPALAVVCLLRDVRHAGRSRTRCTRCRCSTSPSMSGWRSRRRSRWPCWRHLRSTRSAKREWRGAWPILAIVLLQRVQEDGGVLSRRCRGRRSSRACRSSPPSRATRA